MASSRATTRTTTMMVRGKSIKAAEYLEAVPASQSEKSAGDAAEDASKKEERQGLGKIVKNKKNPNSKSLSGSAKMKPKKKKHIKEDSSDEDFSMKTIDNEPEEMTLDEYKKFGKDKSSASLVVKSF